MKLILTLLLTISAANANAAANRLGACAQDAANLCSGKRSISLCLIDREKDLSPECGAMVAGWSKKGAGSPTSSWLGACSQDAEKLCAGKRAVNLCMMEHKKEWSPACRRSMSPPAKKKET